MCTFWHTWRSAKCNFIISVKAECSLPSCGTVMRVRERLGGSGTSCTGGLGPSTLFCLVNIYFLLWSMLRPRFSLWGGSSTITDFIPDHLLDSSNLAVTPGPLSLPGPVEPHGADASSWSFHLVFKGLQRIYATFERATRWTVWRYYFWHHGRQTAKQEINNWSNR